jgi:hypothetical protein
MCSARNNVPYKYKYFHSQSIYEMVSLSGLLGPVDKGITIPWNASNYPQVDVGQQPSREDSSRTRFGKLRYHGVT